jgi:hypothetical protein
LLGAALLALRFPHLTGPLDDPHSWRQCDTAHYSLDFFRRGIDLLHPAVCWLGAHRTLIFEFPLPEAMSALLYRAFGANPLWDRVVALAFFVVADVYLFAIARRVAGPRVAWLAALGYLAVPLGQYYSRAPQVDFAAAAFMHALLFHAMVAFESGAVAHLVLAAAAGTVGVMIKMPYLIPVLGPLALAMLAIPTLATLIRGAMALGVPAVAFMMWRRHVDAVNATAPDWNFLPGYYKEVNPLWWYIGSWSQRLDPRSWSKLVRRLVLEIATLPGIVLAVVGWLGRTPSRIHRPSPALFALAWLAAGMVYLLVFFPLNVIHSYYQVPFLAPVALSIALGADFLMSRMKKIGSVVGSLAFAAFVIVSIVSVPRLGYYRIDWLRVEAGRLIAARVPRQDLLVASDYGAGYSDPRLLFRSDHSGWSLAVPDLEIARLRRLESLGARWVAVVIDPDHPELAAPASLASGIVAVQPITHGGRTLGTLYLYDLRSSLAGRPSGSHG